jgi:transcription-repair coupling factor (superfamily II helicase)
LGSSVSFIIRALFKSGRPFFVFLNDKEEAAYLNDLEQMIGEQDVLFYPGSYRRPYQIEDTDNANVLLRAEVLNRINSRKNRRLLLAIRKRCLKK